MAPTLLLLAALLAAPADPVKVEFQPAGSTSAQVTLTFLVPAQQVDVHFGGSGGLIVQGQPTPIKHGAFAKGQQVKLHVGFTASGEEPKLELQVAGAFAGKPRRVSRSYAVGHKAQAPPH